MGLDYYAHEGVLTIDGISLNRPAFAVIGDEQGRGGLVPLWFKFDVRGEDRQLPNAAGVIAYPRRLTVTRHDLRFLIVGDVDTAGTPVADARIGLEQNIEYIRANILAPVASATGTRTAVLTLPSGATRTAPVHVLGMEDQSYMLNECQAILISTLQISIPSGRLA